MADSTTIPVDSTSLGVPTTVGQLLRLNTRDHHAAVDQAFGSFGLDTETGYTRFLQAHSRILPVAERTLDPTQLLDCWQPRAALLLDDLADMGVSQLPDIAFSVPDDAAFRWGAVYVLEGSRLGGAVLKRRIPAGLPSRFLSAAPAAPWQATLKALDRADEGSVWRGKALCGAQAMFAAYLDAAEAPAETRIASRLERSDPPASF